MDNFSQRFELIYKKFFAMAEAEGKPTSKSALARFFGISIGRLQKWEAGQVPRPDDLVAIHDKLGFAFSWLLTGQGEPFEEGVGHDIATVKALKDELANTKAELEDTRQKLSEAQLLNQKMMVKIFADGEDTDNGTAKHAG